MIWNGQNGFMKQNDLSQKDRCSVDDGTTGLMWILISARFPVLPPPVFSGQTDREGTRGADSGTGLKLLEVLGSRVCDDTFQLETIEYQWKRTTSGGMSTGKRRGKDVKPGSSTAPSLSFLIKTNRVKEKIIQNWLWQHLSLINIHLEVTKPLTELTHNPGTA